MATEVPFQTLALKHLDSLYNYARVLTRHVAEAEDLLQDTLLRAFQHRARIDPDLNPKAWLLKIMKHVHIDRGRRKGSRPHETTFPDADDPPLASREASAPTLDLLDPEAILLRRLAIADVRRAICRLPPPLREAVELRDVEGLSYREIAAIAGMPIGTVMSRLARGRNRVRAALVDAMTPPLPPERTRGV